MSKNFSQGQNTKTAQSSKINKHFINSVSLNEDTWAKMSVFLTR